MDYWRPFITGIMCYLVLWYLFHCRINKLSFFSTFEHELTHCIFAILTFNKVSKFYVTDEQGGYMEHSGNNWLILISPYFFPTFTISLLIFMIFVDPAWLWLMYGLLGAASTSYIIANWKQIHPLQTDLKKVGWGFSALFLPTANMLCYALILADVRLGILGAIQVFHDLHHSSVSPVRLIDMIRSATGA